MSKSDDEYSTVDILSYELGVGNPHFWFERNPEGFISDLTERIKLGAKMLRRAGEMQHSKALDCFAAAIGFSSWYTLSSHLTKMASASSADSSRELMKKLKSALVLFVYPDPEIALSPAQKHAFEDLGAKLAAVAGISVGLILDAVCAGYCGATSWKSVTDRSPLNASTPLYTFRVDEFVPRSGLFVESNACTQLIEQLDEVYQGYSAHTPKDKRKAKAWIESSLSRQPGFLEAGLCLAQIYYDEENLSAARTTIEEYIKRAERLIPKGFRGQIIWGSISNRFYHRMLWLRMTIYHDVGWARYYLKDARKQLRLNPNDNLGVRIIYPLMLLDTGEYEKAAKAARFHNQGGHEQSLVRAFTRFAIGDQPGFIGNLTEALFDLPILRLFLMNDPGDLPDGDTGYRGVRPDMETFVEYAWPAYLAVPGLRKACTDFLTDPLVEEAETQLRRYWKGFWRRGVEAVGDSYGWHGLKSQLTVSIQQHSARAP
jgi:hypothetical protein